MFRPRRFSKVESLINTGEMDLRLLVQDFKGQNHMSLNLLESPIPLCKSNLSEQGDDKFMVTVPSGWKYVAIPTKCGSMSCSKCQVQLSIPMPHLPDANHKEIDLRGASLHNADLSYANLQGVDLNKADLKQLFSRHIWKAPTFQMLTLSTPVCIVLA
jgi:uncharacterized protein YjbI with pentapeptide repeats